MSFAGLTLYFSFLSLFIEGGKNTEKNNQGYVSHVKVTWTLLEWNLTEYDKRVSMLGIKGITAAPANKACFQCCFAIAIHQVPSLRVKSLERRSTPLKGDNVLTSFLYVSI